LFGWGIMTLAMMPPLAIPLIRHVATRSFVVRRNRAITAFLAGVLVVWLLAGLVALTLLGGAPATLFGWPGLAAAAFLFAAVWQLAPMKRAALARCHRTVPLGATGWRADWDCLRYGLTHGLNCVTSCWAAMFAVILASGGPMLCLAVQLVALVERRSLRPRPGLSALALLACALVTLPV
jgi:predicted metal-binding membrane protein